MDLVSTTTAQGRIGHCRIRSEGTLLECLETLGLSREEGERLLSMGAIYHEHERVQSNRALVAGHYVRVHLNPRRFPVEAVDWPAAVVHENDRFIVVNKPPGIPVHATVDNRVENVLHQLTLALGSPLHITQRLDTEVSGLVVFARTREFQRQFNQMLVERKVKKKYLALVNRAPDAGRHVHYMKPAERSPKTVGREAHPGWRECALKVDRVTRMRCTPGASGKDLFELELDLETGRTHQIRVQLSAMGSPIVGDKLYGSGICHDVNGVVREGIALCSVSTSWSDECGDWSFTLDASWRA